MGYGCEVSCRRSLPAVYDDSLSYYEQVCKLYNILNKTIEHVNLNSEDIEKLKKAVAQLGELLDNWTSGKFDETIRNEVVKWIAENVKFIFETYSKQVFFGLTDDGYFCAYVPQSWSEISFDTGAVYGTEEYGRLILRFAADGQGVIDNRYDTRTLIDVVDSILDVETGDGLKHEQGKLSLDLGNGLSINRDTKMVEVPIGANLRYTSQGIDVPDGDSITKGVVKLSHKVENETDDTVAVSPQAVFAYAQPKAQ